MGEGLLIERPVVGALSSAAGAGVLFGVFQGIEQGSAAAGVANGIYFAILMGVWWAVLARRRGPGLPRSLHDDDKRTVLRCVNRGEALADPRLAPAVIQYAQWQQKPLPGRWYKLLIGTLLVLTVIYLVVAVVEGNVWGAIQSLFGMGLWLFALFWAPVIRSASWSGPRPRSALLATSSRDSPAPLTRLSPASRGRRRSGDARSAVLRGPASLDHRTDLSHRSHRLVAGGRGRAAPYVRVRNSGALLPVARQAGGIPRFLKRSSLPN